MGITSKIILSFWHFLCIGYYFVKRVWMLDELLTYMAKSQFASATFI